MQIFIYVTTQSGKHYAKLGPFDSREEGWAAAKEHENAPENQKYVLNYIMKFER